MTTEKLLTSAGVAGAFVFDLVAGAYMWKSESPLPESGIIVAAAIVLTVATVLFRVRAERDFYFG